MAKSFFISFCIFALLSSGCASRLPMMDEVGKPVSKEEISQKRTNKNFWLFTVGGGALSFGASFFAGALIDRDANSDHTKLWAITAAGTVLGTVLFAHNGRVRDFNMAVEAVKDTRKASASNDISREQDRQKQLADEKEKLEEERKKQEMERERLMEEIRKRQAQKKP